jgi:hypothetical protein
MSTPGNNHQEQGSDDQPRELAPLPEFLPGNRMVSSAGLHERIAAAFEAENEGRLDLYAADAQAQRDALRDVIDYTLATESITLSRSDRFRLLDDLHRELFGFDPLTDLLADESVTEIIVRHAQDLHVRRGAGDPQPSGLAFRDTLHLERLIRRVLRPTGFDFRRDPLIEAGVLLGGRPARLFVLGAPLSPVLHATLRLHPRQVRSLDDLIAAGMMDGVAARLLRGILASGHGLLVAGEAGAGKTTLLNALLNAPLNAPLTAHQAALPTAPAGQVSVVERAAELRLPEGVARYATTSEQTFPAQLQRASLEGRGWLVVDEVRFDDSAEMWAALTSDRRPRCLWAIRGSTEAVRLRTAFGMAVRRAMPGIEQTFIDSALLDRLPFVAFLARREGALRLVRLGEWVAAPGDPPTAQLRTVWPSEDAPTTQRALPHA